MNKAFKRNTIKLKHNNSDILWNFQFVVPKLKVFLLLLLLGLGYSTTGFSAAKTAVASGVWSSTVTWNAPVPVSGDAVSINANFTVTVDINNAACASLQLGKISNGGTAETGTLTFAASGNPSLTVSGAVTIGGAGNKSPNNGFITFTSGSSMTAGSMQVGNVSGTGTISMTSGGILSVGGAITTDITQGATWTSGAGTLILSATNTLPANTFTSFNNLTVSAGTTTLGVAIAVNGILTQTAGNIANGGFLLTVNGTHNAGSNLVSGTGGYTLGSGATFESTIATGVNGNITSSGTKTFNTNNKFIFDGSVAQVTGTTMPASIANLTINNSAGVSMSQTTAISGTLTLTSGTFTIGAFTLTLSGNTAPSRTSGNIDASNASATLTFTNTSGVTLPASLFIGNIKNLTMNGAGGVTLGDAITVAGTLTLTSGILTTTGTNLLSITNTAAAAISGGSTASHINGPLKRSLIVANYTFPVGNGGVYYPFGLNATVVGSSPIIQVQAFVGDVGASATVTNPIKSISHNEYWQGTLVSGTFTGTVSLTRIAAVGTGSVIGQSSSQNGSYSTIGGTIASPSINTSSAINSMGFFVIGNATRSYGVW